jgi:hypothetical protein
VSKRGWLLINSMFRMGYGVGALFAPATMTKLWLAPDTRERPDARLFIRGFGAHQVAVASLGLASRRWRRLEQPAALAAVTIDAFDIISALIEARDRGQCDPDVSGGVAFSAAGAVTAAAALLAE